MPSFSDSFVLFDVGNTLITPRCSVGETYSKTAKKYGLFTSPDEVQARFITAFQTHSRTPHCRQLVDHLDFWEKIVEDSLGIDRTQNRFDFDSCFQELFEFYHSAEAWKIFPEVFPTLEKLKHAQIPMGILSNWDKRLHLILEELDLKKFFDPIFISEEVGAEKPDEKIYQAVESTLKRSPEQLIMVGDEWTNDVELPQTRGWRTCYIERPHRHLDSVFDVLDL